MRKYSLLLLVFLVGCATVSYEDAQGRKFSYSRFGNQAIKGLKTTQTANGVDIQIESVQSDTQALTDAFTKALDKVKP
jgi:hypothetical protein